MILTGPSIIRSRGPRGSQRSSPQPTFYWSATESCNCTGIGEPSKNSLADEPTGNLDPANTDRSLGILRSLCQQWGSSLILVSHDPRVIDQFETHIDWEELNQVKKEQQVVADHH